MRTLHRRYQRIQSRDYFITATSTPALNALEVAEGRAYCKNRLKPLCGMTKTSDACKTRLGAAFFTTWLKSMGIVSVPVAVLRMIVALEAEAVSVHP